MSTASDEVTEGRTPPGPLVVVYNVGGHGFERSVMSVELARLVTSAVVVRVTNWRQRTFHQALQAYVHGDRARNLVDHLLARLTHPLPTCTSIAIRQL